MLFLGNERGVRWMIRREEECAVRQLLEAVDVSERSPERQRREGHEDQDAKSTPLHPAEILSRQRGG